MSKIAADSGHAQNFFLFVFEKSYLSLFFFPLRSKLTDMLLVIKYENLFRNSASHCCTLIFFWSSIAKNLSRV